MIKSLQNTSFARFMQYGMNKVMWMDRRNAMYAPKSYEETELHQALVVNADSLGYTFDNNDDRPERLFKAFFCAVSAFLSKKKVSKADEAVALVVENDTGVFKMAGIVEYTINETNPDEPGNWSYVLTFSEDDIIKLEKHKTVKKYFISDEVFRIVMDKVAYDIGGFVLDRESYTYDVCNLVVDTILQVLDHEAIDGQTVDVVFDGYFTASVAVENGVKIFSIVPDGHLKAIIKDDVMLDDN